MATDYSHAVRDALWPGRTPQWSKLCAVLDGARDDRIFPAVERSRVDKCCLYAGRIPWILQRAAPHLVVLDPADPLTNFLLDDGWGKSWGIYFRTEAPMMQVRRHLRTLLRVKDESGRILIFRWYDPRVFRRYLPTCNSTELATVFGPIQTFYCEAEDPSRLLQFRRSGDHLEHLSRTLGSNSNNAGKL